jgi:hypothetical protein
MPEFTDRTTRDVIRDIQESRENGTIRYDPFVAFMQVKQYRESQRRKQEESEKSE